MVGEDVLLLYYHICAIPYDDAGAPLVLVIAVACHALSCDNGGAPLTLNDVMGPAVIWELVFY